MQENWIRLKHNVHKHALIARRRLRRRVDRSFKELAVKDMAEVVVLTFTTCWAAMATQVSSDLNT